MQNTTIKPTVEKKTRNKKSVQWLADYLNLRTGNRQDVTDQFLEDLAIKLVKWVQADEEAIVLSDFYTSLGVSYNTFYKWVQMSPVLMESRDLALEIMGARREKGAASRKYAEGIMMKSMAIYKPEWREIEKWRSDMKVEQVKADSRPIVLGTLKTED